MLRRLIYAAVGFIVAAGAAYGIGVAVDFNGMLQYIIATPNPNTRVQAVTLVDANGAAQGGGGATSSTVQGPEAAGATAAANPFVNAIVSGAGVIARALSITSSLNSNGTGIPVAGLAAVCDDISQTAITENSFGAARMGCADHIPLVSPQPYPYTATPETASSGNVAAATATATLAASASKTTYITGFQCTSGGSTASASVNVTVVGTITGTMTYAFNGGTLAAAGDQMNVAFPYPVPASAVNTTIVTSMPTLGAGNTQAACSAQGFQL